MRGNVPIDRCAYRLCAYRHYASRHFSVSVPTFPVPSRSDSNIGALSLAANKLMLQKIIIIQK